VRVVLLILVVLLIFLVLVAFPLMLHTQFALFILICSLVD
jgi:hypothetical protein